MMNKAWGMGQGARGQGDRGTGRHGDTKTRFKFHRFLSPFPPLPLSPSPY